MDEPGDEPPRQGLHGRRRGKRLRSHHQDLMTNLLPALRLRDAGDVGDMLARSGTAGRDLWLEIGFGGGEHLAAEARARPDVDFIGCEPFLNGVAKLLAEIAAGDLANIRVVPDDAAKLLAVLPDASVGRVWLLFPDPWPKRRQKKRRFINPENLAALARVMKPGAELRFATDIDDYAGWGLVRILDCGWFDWTNARAALWTRPWDGHATTRYEEWAIGQGRQPAYLTFSRRAFPTPQASPP